jgi:tetratricopeptide (TPR) repeat protein
VTAAGERAVWPPLRPLGPMAVRVGRALGSASVADVVKLIDEVAARLTTPRQHAALEAARLGLGIRRGTPDAADHALAERIIAAFRREDEPVLAEFVGIAAALWEPPQRALVRLHAIDEALLERSVELLAAALCAEGSLARTTGDLRASLALLGRGLRAARQANAPREQLRCHNSLGTSYASLGLTQAARRELFSAVELAGALSEMQSLAIAEGQLAVLALEEGDAPRAQRSLERQASIARQLGDEHGLARALSLSVEALGASSRLTEATTVADECRALHRAVGSAWTLRQATFATLYEAEAAFAHGRTHRGDALLADLGPRADLPLPVRARLSVAHAARASGQGEMSAQESEKIAKSATSEVEGWLAELRLSPRPAWVQHVLTRSAEVVAAGDHEPAIARALALRAAHVSEQRHRCRAPLDALGHIDPSSALDRAMARVRDLMATVRLALAPLRPWSARTTFVEAKTPRQLDAVVGLVLSRAAESDGHDLLVSPQGPLRVVLARASGGSLDAWTHDLGKEPGVALFSTTAVLTVTDDPTGDLALVAAPWHVSPHADAAGTPAPTDP